MTYKYNKSDNTVSPVVEKPLCYDLFIKNNKTALGLTGTGYYQCIGYEEEIKNLPRIPVSGEHKWRDGYFVTEGVHFKLVNQNHPSPYINPNDKVVVKDLGNGAAEFHAWIAITLPINEGKEQIKPFDFELLDKEIKEKFPMKKVEGKEAESEDDVWKEIIEFVINKSLVPRYYEQQELINELKKQFTITCK